MKNLAEQREIKFRAWDDFENTMEYSVSLIDSTHHDGTHTYYVGLAGDRSVKIDEFCPVMQYTGLKDKKGVEIYEGDIVKTEGKNLVMKWNDIGIGGWWLFSIDAEGVYVVEPKIKTDDMEVIGNKWENGDLK